MRFAYVDNQRVEPTKGQVGRCQCCGTEVVAKCGQFKSHHWAHKNLTLCDPWWENESEWHRRWKSYFPPERQEVVFNDPTSNERHIADVYSEKGVVLEFQSYAIDPTEMAARERYYQQLVWVINGSKNEFDRINFGLSVCAPYTADPMLRNIHWYGRGKIFAKWSYATKHVYLDFGTDLVWHLVTYHPLTKKGQVRAYPKQQFVEFFGGVYASNVASAGG